MRLALQSETMLFRSIISYVHGSSHMPSIHSTPLVPPLEFEKTLAGRRILVTGHTGFTGGWLSLWLTQIGAKVTGLSLAPMTTPNLFESAKVGAGLTSIIGDIRDAALVNKVVEESQSEVIIHLAAQPLVSLSFDDPLGTYATNVMGTAHVLEAARNVSSVKAVVCITTDKVYADQAWPWGYREVDPLGGKDPYSASKACAELLTASYRATLATRGNGVAIATARGGNIIGGGDWSANRIVPDFVRAVVAGEPLTLRNPEAVRPWQHVMALVHGYLVLAHNLLTRPTAMDAAFNLGPLDDEAMPVSALVDAFQRNWSPVPIHYTPGQFPETGYLYLDSTKARRSLGWKPPLDFEKTVSLTVDWYRRYYENPAHAQAITLEQITAYRAALGSA
jgi:CDP-glucose 4,6-dehydratase